MTANEKIKLRREELGLTDSEGARLSGLSIYEYGDVESYKDEIFNVVPLYHIKKLCLGLKVDFLTLFEMPCAFCQGDKYLMDYILHRNELIKKKREESGLSIETLGDKVGFFPIEIQNLETYTAHLESWVLDNIFKLSSVLKIPSQILIDVKCPKCGQ